MTTNRSTDELGMRVAVEAWGRARWPDARMVHELVTGERRIDMAFIGPDYLVGVEIKSARDVLTRLADQCVEFDRCIPEVWLVLDPKWAEQHSSGHYQFGRATVEDGKVVEGLPLKGYNARAHHPAKRRARITVPMMHLLWRAELYAMAKAAGRPALKRHTISDFIDDLSRALTGDQIVSGVCAQLRGRSAFPVSPPSDPPIGAGAVATAQDLFRTVSP